MHRWTLLGLLFAGAAFAQTGPSPVRVVVSAAGSKTLNATEKLASHAVLAKLSVDAQGRVTEVQLVEQSGSTRFDAEASKYFSGLRFIPRIDANGTPVAGTFSLGLKYNPPSPEKPKSGAPPEEQVYDEAARIARMKCKDFLWEYGLMREIAGSNLRPLNEEMFRTAMAKYLSTRKVGDKQVASLSAAFSNVVRDTAKECRTRESAAYFSEVLAPALDARLAR